MLVSVLRPIASFGRTSSTRYSRAARAISASVAVEMPGAMAPPMNSPAAFTQSNVVAVSRSTTMSGGPERAAAAADFVIPSAPPPRGGAAAGGILTLTPGAAEDGPGVEDFSPTRPPGDPVHRDAAADRVGQLQPARAHGRQTLALHPLAPAVERLEQHRQRHVAVHRAPRLERHRRRARRQRGRERALAEIHADAD